jgi:hypothetical protein
VWRRAIFESVLWTFDVEGNPQINLAVCGRAKKNWKSTDEVLTALYRLLAWPSDKGNDCYILANDDGQAADDLTLAKKLIVGNPILARELTLTAKAIERKDGRGRLQILPANDVAGARGFAIAAMASPRGLFSRGIRSSLFTPTGNDSRQNAATKG